MTDLIGFPSEVNEVAARTVATGVGVICVVAIAARQPWLTIPLVYGFSARVLSGPRFSPLGLLATRVVAPRLTRFAHVVPGPPKRFAQAIGAAFSLSALGLWLAGELAASDIMLAMLALAAALEASIGLCLGCRIFGLGVRLGIIPASVCPDCDDLWGPSTRGRREISS